MRGLLEHGGGAEALDRVTALAQAERVAVMCVERERARCHRDVVTNLIAEQHPDIEVIQIL
jgi:uncharacterized protein (DUF488 family)